MTARRGREFFLGRRVPVEFDVRRVVVAPGAERAFDEEEWRGAIVAVETGSIELAFRSGGRWQCRRGDVLWLEGLPLRALRNRGPAPTVLIAVARSGACASVEQRSGAGRADDRLSPPLVSGRPSRRP